MSPYPMMMGYPPVNAADAPGQDKSRDIFPPKLESAGREKEDDKPAEPVEFAEVGYNEIFRQFILLGWTAFGGPSAHIALFQKVSRVLPFYPPPPPFHMLRMLQCGSI